MARVSTPKTAWLILKESVLQFFADPVLRLSAATAYYAIFSIGPLLVLAVWLAAFVFGKEEVGKEVGRQLESFVGPKAREMLQSMMGAQMKGDSTWALMLGSIALVFGATAVFTQLQDSLNTIWGVQAKPGNSIGRFIRDRVLSLAMVVGIGFLLLVSMVLSTFVSAFSHYIGQAVSLPDWVAPAFEIITSFLIISLLFALIFKVLPDVKIEWGDVWVGAAGTAVLFSIGKYFLGLYLSHETEASAYGAASVFIVILLYVYYASLILYFGAEFTQVYARHRGGQLRPSRYAVRVDRQKAERPHRHARRK